MTTFDTALAFDFPAPFDVAAIFTPPIVADRPPYLPDSTGPARALFRHYAPTERGVNVFKLSDGSYAQDTATSENGNTAVPYPWDPSNPSAPFWSGWDPINLVEQSSSLPVWISIAYLGGRSYPVSATEVAALTAAGYGGRLS